MHSANSSGALLPIVSLTPLLAHLVGLPPISWSPHVWGALAKWPAAPLACSLPRPCPARAAPPPRAAPPRRTGTAALQLSWQIPKPFTYSRVRRVNRAVLNEKRQDWKAALADFELANSNPAFKDRAGTLRACFHDCV